jgi:transposase
MRPNAGGIDIGATEIFVAVPADRDDETVRSFPTFTEDLQALADWLQRCGVDTVAMESTGVYWIPLFQILEARGIEVHLVNAQHVHHVPGRKSDVWTVSGCSIYIPWVYCGLRFGPTRRFARFVP